MGSFATWNPYTNYVQAGMQDGRFVNGGFTLIAAGPPRLSELGGQAAIGQQLTQGDSDIVYGIGAIQNFNMSQNKTFFRVMELGSDRAYLLGGRTVGQLALGRVYYHGPSLLRAIYAYYRDPIGRVTVDWVFPNPGPDNVANKHDVIVAPGFENLFLNLASDLFNQPIGLLLFVRDSELDVMGAIYLESVVVPNHTWATDAQGTIVQESVALQYERIVPVEVAAVALVTGLEAGIQGTEI